jgi:DNA-binding MarR family transcriptional regulator
MTQERFASILGVGRSYASRQIQRFKAEGLVDTRRGGLIVKDTEGLRARACACNEQVRAHFDQVLKGVYPDENGDG